jgi:hypothetical protein
MGTGPSVARATERPVTAPTSRMTNTHATVALVKNFVNAPLFLI